MTRVHFFPEIKARFGKQMIIFNSHQIKYKGKRKVTKKIRTRRDLDKNEQIVCFWFSLAILFFLVGVSLPLPWLKHRQRQSHRRYHLMLKILLPTAIQNFPGRMFQRYFLPWRCIPLMPSCSHRLSSLHVYHSIWYGWYQHGHRYHPIRQMIPHFQLPVYIICTSCMHD